MPVHPLTLAHNRTADAIRELFAEHTWKGKYVRSVELLRDAYAELYEALDGREEYEGLRSRLEEVEREASHLDNTLRETNQGWSRSKDEVESLRAKILQLEEDSRADLDARDEEIATLKGLLYECERAREPKIVSGDDHE